MSYRSQAPCCGKLYACRLCHDGAEGHRLDRFRVTEVQCTRCRLLQKVGPVGWAGGAAILGGAPPPCWSGAGVSVPHLTAVSPVLLSSPVRRQAQQRCEGCHSLFGEYYCGICHLFDRDKKQYHCTECGICRYVRGGRDPRAGPCP